MKTKSYVPKTAVADVRCALCSGVLESLLVSKKKRFRVDATYTTGELCPACQDRVEVAVREVKDGGCLVMCKSCDDIGYLPHGKAPENVDVIVTTCPQCKDD